MNLQDPLLKPAADAAREGDAGRAAELGSAYVWNELNGWLDPDTLQELVDWHITGRDLLRLDRELFPLYRMKARLAADADTRRHLICRAYDFGQDSLDRGGVDEALRFFTLAAGEAEDAAVFDHARRMFTSICELRDVVRREGARVAPSEGACTIASVVWGNTYIDNYLNYMVRSLMAPGNLPGLRDRDIHFSIITTPAGRKRIEAHPMYASMRHHAAVHIFTFPEHLTTVGDQNNPNYGYYQLYGSMDHMNILFSREFGANTYFLPVDCIVARNTLVNLLHYVDAGFDAVGMTNMVAKREPFLPMLDRAFGTGPVLDAAPRQLANMALSCLHQESYGNMVIPENRNFSRWARDMFWPVDGGVQTRCVYVHPLCVSGKALQRDFDMTYKWVDLTLASCLFPTPADYVKFKLVANTDEAYISNFATENRGFESTGQLFSPELFAEGARHARGVNRWFLTQEQFIPCDPPFRTDRDREADVAEVLAHLQRINPL